MRLSACMTHGHELARHERVNNGAQKDECGDQIEWLQPDPVQELRVDSLEPGILVAVQRRGEGPLYPGAPTGPNGAAADAEQEKEDQSTGNAALPVWSHRGVSVQLISEPNQA